MEKTTLKEETSSQEVLFRRLVDEFPSTTYATFGLYRYPAKFIPQVIAYVLKKYTCPGMSVFDPFAGYGTVGVVAKIYGNDYELWDLNPMLKNLHEVAIMDPVVMADFDSLISKMESSEQSFVPQWSNLHYWFPQEVLPFLFKVWGFYHYLEDKPTKRLLLIPLMKATRSLSYNDAQRQKLSRSPIVMERVSSLLTRNWQDLFFKAMRNNLSDVQEKLEEYSQLRPKPVKVIVKAGVDALSIDLEDERDVLVTSPPYLQAQEYIRASKMDLFWLGYPETKIKELSKMEIPYRAISPCAVHSETYKWWYDQLQNEPRMRSVLERYFWGVLGALTRLQSKIRSYLCLFVGSANIRGRQVPIDRIFTEHFSALGWTHEVTLIDTIVSRVMFSYGKNPATGLTDNRMRKEYLVVLRREG